MAGANQVLALLVLDADANRLAIKYCSGGLKLWPSVEDQRKFERKTIQKLPKPSGRASSETDVALIGEQLVVFKICNDVYICVVCSPNENELVVAGLCDGVAAALTQTTQMSFVSNGLSKQTVLDQLDQVLLVLDEVTDDGIIMEVDDEKIFNRVRMVEAEGGGGGNNDAAGGGEADSAVFQQATKAAKKRLIESLLGGRS